MGSIFRGLIQLSFLPWFHDLLMTHWSVSIVVDIVVLVPSFFIYFHGGISLVCLLFSLWCYPTYAIPPYPISPTNIMSLGVLMTIFQHIFTGCFHLRHHQFHLDYWIMDLFLGGFNWLALWQPSIFPGVDPNCPKIYLIWPWTTLHLIDWWSYHHDNKFPGYLDLSGNL